MRRRSKRAGYSAAGSLPPSDSSADPIAGSPSLVADSLVADSRVNADRDGPGARVAGDAAPGDQYVLNCRALATRVP